MQPIQDKDFDQLFKNAFEDAEIAPSRDLWSSIEEEIVPKKKRIIPVYWLSAAAVLLVATLGFLVYQQHEVKPKEFANNISFKSPKPIADTPQTSGPEEVVKVPSEIVKKPLPVQSKPSEALAKTEIKQDIKREEKQKVITAPEMQKQETVLAQVATSQDDIKTKIDEAILSPKQDAVIAMAEPVQEQAEDDENQSRGIRNVGDVVNLIVNKVDKRKDKIIQFRTDDDDSLVSSINIGPFKFGKKNKR